MENGPRTGEPSSQPAERTIRVVPRIAAALLFFAVIEGLVFHTRLYPSIIEIDSTTGSVEIRVRAEQLRAKVDPNQVIALGNSRMSLLPRLTDQMTPPTGYHFASIAAPGTYARAWYYLIRSVDPSASAYAAVLVPSDDYDELDRSEDLENRQWDLNYLLARLELRDLFAFPASYSDTSLRWAAFRAILLKGFVYKRDLQEFLLDPHKRFLEKQFRARWPEMAYNWIGPDDNLAGLEIDWQQRTARYPERITPDQRKSVEETLLAPKLPDSGRYTAYYRQWYGRILEHYRGSPTKIIFLRLPRGPVTPPDHPPKNNSAARQLASHPNVIILDEHLFDSLERPELFMDALHLNRQGMERFAPMLATAIRKALGPPRS